MLDTLTKGKSPARVVPPEGPAGGSPGASAVGGRSPRGVPRRSCRPGTAVVRPPLGLPRRSAPAPSLASARRSLFLLSRRGGREQNSPGNLGAAVQVESELGSEAVRAGGEQRSSLETRPVNRNALISFWQFARSLRVGRLLGRRVEQE